MHRARRFQILLSEVCRLLVVVAAVVIAGAQPVLAASTVDTFTFASAEHEQRYRGLIAEIRCPMCQNVNIAGSDAPIAKDLRVTVHRLLADGMSNQEILDFLQARYGDFVLYDPPVRSNTLVLWVVPLLGFLLIVGVVLRLARQTPESVELSEDDAERLRGVLEQTGAGGAAEFVQTLNKDQQA